MTVLTPRQIAAVAAAAGFTGRDLQISVAVAMSESGGNDQNSNYIPCYGLWQINYPAWHPSHPTWTKDWLFVPDNNAKAAYVVWKGSGWAAWSTYTSGDYQKHMDAAAAGVANRGAGDFTTSGSDTTGSSIVIGPKMGAYYNPTTTVLQNKPTLSDFTLMGSKLQDDIAKAVISATVSFTTDQVSQVEVTFLDPDFKFLKSGLGKKGTPATFQNMRLVIATTSTSDTSGTPTVTLKCRPEVVQKLKNRRGTFVMQSASPSQFVQAECKAVGANAYIQASPQRMAVMRDVPTIEQSGIPTHYDKGSEPSSWTTFQRLAQELGFICFEENGTIYFGQPTYFTLRGKKQPLVVDYNTGSKANRSLVIPVCSTSLDDYETTVEVQLPVNRAAEARCGRALQLTGVSDEFDGFYMVNSVSYNLNGNTDFITVDAETPINPIPQPPTGSTLGVGGSVANGVASSNGSWPLPSKYKVTTAYGVRGPWQAGYHTGSDFACPVGTDAYAVYDGTIVGINTEGAAYGNHIMLKVGNKEYLYAHLSRILVAKGDQVVSGQRIGLTGATGNVTGPHLHLELRHSPYKYGDDENPMPTLMKKKNYGTNLGTGLVGSKLASDFVYFAQSRVGDAYVYGAPRTPSNANTNTFDCSSLVQWAAYQVGIHNFPGDTTSQTMFCAAKGTGLDVTEAVHLRGALLYKIGGGGVNDHVVISLGNGKTIEAMGTNYGVVNGSATGRGFNVAYKLPGLKY